MIFLGLLFIVLYLIIYIKTFTNISKGKFEYILYFICLALPFYATLQAQIFEIFKSELLVNTIKFSKDLIFFYALLVFLFGKNESVISRSFNFSNLDKLVLAFVILILFYTLIPLGEADFFSKVIYAKNILLIPLVYFIGRNIELSDEIYNNLKKIFLVIIVFSSVFVFFEFIFSTHFHTLIDYASYNSIVNEIDPQGNYGLSWSFEGEGSRPRYAAFFADPLELSASLLLFTILFYVFVYTIWLKRRTSQNIVIGGASGALPPVIGWAMATNTLSLESLAFFIIIFLWTPSHFWALSLYKADDYRKAKIPMLPITNGIEDTKKNIFIYSILMVPSVVFPYLIGFVGELFLTLSLLLTSYYIYICYQLYNFKINKFEIRKAKKVFGYSIIYLFLIFALFLFDNVI